MGCGASQDTEPCNAKKYGDAGADGEHKAVQRDARDPDPYDEPASPEQLQLQEQIDEQLDGDSVAESADEPTPFKKDMRISVKKLQARWMHGITADAEQFDPGRVPAMRPKQVLLVTTYIDRMVEAAEVDTTLPDLVLGHRHSTTSGGSSTIPSMPPTVGGASLAPPLTTAAPIPHAVEGASNEGDGDTAEPAKTARRKTGEVPLFAAVDLDASDSEAANVGSPRVAPFSPREPPGAFGSRSLVLEGTPRLSPSSSTRAPGAHWGCDPVFVDLGLQGRQFLFAPIFAQPPPLSPASFPSAGSLSHSAGPPLQPPPMSLSVMSDSSSRAPSMGVSVVRNSLTPEVAQLPDAPRT
jgi:hypothetical protein